MLPPPITTSATTMGIRATTTRTTTTTTPPNNNLNSHKEHHHESAFLYESMDTASASAPAPAPSSKVNHNNATQRLKAFFHKTLANVSKTNISDYNAQYASSSTFSASVGQPTSPQLSSSRETYDDIVVGSISDGVGGDVSGGFVGNITDGFGSYATAAAAADIAVTTLSNSTTHLETTTAAASAFPTAQTVATFIAGNKNRATTIIVYPTVSPESIVIPIVSCIFGFPILAFIVICCLRHRAKLARERDRRRNYDMQDHAVSLVRFSPIHRLNYRSSRAISLRPERSLSQGFTSLELDTVVEERCSDVEQTQTEIIHPESPLESSTSYKMSLSSS